MIPSCNSDACEQEETIEKLQSDCTLVLAKLPKITTDMESLEGKIASYSKIALSLVGALCAISTYGYFEVNTFREQYHANNVVINRQVNSTKSELLVVTTRIKDDISILERRMYERDEKIMSALSSVQAQLAKALAWHDRP